MTQTLYNGAVVPTASDAYQLTADLQKLCLSLNIPLAVNDLTARNGLAALAPNGVLPVGTMVIRKDQSMFVEKWDGTAWKTSGHSEWTKTAHVVPTNTVYGVGALTQDAAKTTDTAFVTHPATDVLQLRDVGTYSIAFSIKATAALSTRAFVQFDKVGGTIPLRVVLTGEDQGFVAFPNYRASAANEQILFTIYHESGANRTMDVRIRIARNG